ncbi:hypothetical protein C2845_PM13G23000 [Panicum miliaceum]|uniref:BTB domain-containing protein n=1 Tax=Panicum miliaceum TaxID=4540 RepID=A0A3L6RJ30_PANMI|nr:hypothetical protein C2845_PM13G23000 [Panicum miliaceum]
MPTCWDSGFTELKLDLAATTIHVTSRDVVLSDLISVGGHVWRVSCYPRRDDADRSYTVNLYLHDLFGESKNITAIFEAFLVGRDGAPSPSPSHAQRCVHVYSPGASIPPGTGFRSFVIEAALNSDYVKDGCVTFMIGVIVPRERGRLAAAAAVPPSDVGDHLGGLLDRAEGSDVSFLVGDEEFPAHRAVLAVAARSPVFRAQLLGSMADAKSRRITMHDVKPATFRILLRFMYTDRLPPDEELGSSSAAELLSLFQDLLAAADMYQLDRMKLMCAHRVFEFVSAESVAEVLGCAETHSCPELNNWCLEFIVV